MHLSALERQDPGRGREEGKEGLPPSIEAIFVENLHNFTDIQPIAVNLHLGKLGSEHVGQVVDSWVEGQVTDLFLEVGEHGSNSRNIPAEEHLNVHYFFLQEPCWVNL